MLGSGNGQFSDFLGVSDRVTARRSVDRAISFDPYHPAVKTLSSETWSELSHRRCTISTPECVTGARAQTFGSNSGHGGTDAEVSRFIRCSAHYGAIPSPGNNNGFASELRIVPLLNGRIKRVHVDMNDLAHGCLATMVRECHCAVQKSVGIPLGMPTGRCSGGETSICD